MVSEQDPSYPILGSPKLKIAHAPDAKHWAWGGVLNNDKSPTSVINEMGELFIRLGQSSSLWDSFWSVS